ncbi:MAG TPA: signal peptidase I [Candidatus Acidoferrum sp.]|nr:signal peptidase I [Candidatus Acidoferrum sp.]
MEEAEGRAEEALSEGEEVSPAPPDSSVNASTRETSPDRASQASRGHQTTVSEYFESLLVTVILALFGTTFVVQAFKIPSPSMEPTLMVGDHLLVNKFIFGGHGAWYEKILPYRPLRRGDIIVFKYPLADHQHFVKRVIGLPGDHLKLVDQQVYVGGQKLNEPYVFHDPTMTPNPLNYDFPLVAGVLYTYGMRPEWASQIHNYIRGNELVVPPGKYFVMGDNRDDSDDSRYWGFVDQSAIMGRPFLIYWSINATTSDYGQSTFLQRLDSTLDTLIHLPERTRWNRMLHTVH